VKLEMSKRLIILKKLKECGNKISHHFSRRFKYALNVTIAVPIIKFLKFAKQDDLIVWFIVWWMIITEQGLEVQPGFDAVKAIREDRDARG